MVDVSSETGLEGGHIEDSDAPLVSIIIVNYNGIRFLKPCLDSLIAQSYRPIEIILVDNGSSDGSVKFVKENYPAVRVIENQENYGFAKANNIGIRVARGTLIATLNNDTKVMPGWVEALVKAVTSGERIGMCASKMLFMNKPGIIDSTGVCFSRSGACWDRGMFERDDGQYGKMEEVFGPCAGAAIYKKEMLDEVGLFDEDFYAYMEDADLAFRGRLAGWTCLYVPAAVVYHVHGGSFGYDTPNTIYYGNRNIIWNVVKNYPMTMLITSLPFVICRNMAVIPYYAIRGYGIPILRSKIDAIKGVPRMFARRTQDRGREQKIYGFINTWAKLPRPGKDSSANAMAANNNISIVK